MNRRQTYYFIGSLLSRVTNSSRRQSAIQCFQSPDFDWHLFIAMGSNHLVLQTIYCRLLEDELIEYLPTEVNLHLKHIYDLNTQRNTEIIEQVHSINTLLNNKGIVPLYLKGVGNILDGLYQNIAERIMHDIDILVPDEQWLPATQILLKDGYRELSKYDPYTRIKLKHYPPLYKSGSKASIEIHRLPVDFKYSKTITTDEVWTSKKSLTGKGNCYVMCDRHKIILNFVHSQLVHNGHLYAKVPLRNLYDLYLLSSREDIDVNFADIPKYANQAASYQRVMQNVFGVKYKKNITLPLKSRMYLVRYEINLRSRIISLITFLTTILFKTYFMIPFRSISDKELRKSLLKKLFEKNWYKRHFKSLTRIYN